MKNNLLEVVEEQSNIISIQAELINKLFLELAQHINIEEAENRKIASKVKMVEKLRQGTE